MLVAVAVVLVREPVLAGLAVLAMVLRTGDTNRRVPRLNYAARVDGEADAAEATGAERTDPGSEDGEEEEWSSGGEMEDAEEEMDDNEDMDD